jgi:hypothetical protein
MDEAQFQRALITVLIAGGVAVTIGTVVLYLAFRSVGRKRYFLFIGGLVAFLFLCCVALFTLDFVGR